jgi:hypothetical protein
MKDLLQPLSGIHGIIGSFIYNTAGQIVTTNLPTTFNQQALMRAGSACLLGWQGLETAGKSLKINLLSFEFDEFTLFIKKAGQMLVASLTSRDVSFPELSITMNIVATHLQEETDIAIAPADSYAQQRIKTPERFLTEFTRSLAEMIGPFAKIVIEDKMKELRLSRDSLSKSEAIRLINLAGKEIGDAAASAEFSRRMIQFIEKLIS